MDLINLDVDYVSPSCLTPSGKWTYSDSYYTLLVIPFIPLFFVGTLGLLAKGWAKYIKRDSIYGLRLSFMCVTEMQVRRYFLGLVNAAIPFLGIVYNNICIKSFNAFSCQTLRSGVVVMRAAPSIVCYEPEHNAIIWRVRRFPGGAEFMLTGEVELVKSTKGKAWVKPPLTVDFQVPMFTASGLHVRSLKVYERSNYPTTKWVRYVTRAGSYSIRLS